jgi:hypothetical protein
MEAIEFGIMLVAEDGFVTFANARARDLIRRGEGLRANGGWIAATSPEVTSRLRAFIRHSAAETDAKRAGSATVVLERGANQSSLFVHVMPIERRSKAAARSATALIFIIDPEDALLIALMVIVSKMPDDNPLKRVLTALSYRIGATAAAGLLAIPIEPIPGLDVLYDIGVPVALIIYWISFFKNSSHTTTDPSLRRAQQQLRRDGR